MSTSTVLGAVAFLLIVVAVVIVSAAVVAGLRERAYQREVERRYAEAWVRTHRAHQHNDRYTTADERRPE